MGQRNPSARWSVTDGRNLPSPGQCSCCGTCSQEVEYAFPNLHFEFYGTLFFCASCILEGAFMFDIVALEKFKELETANKALELEAMTLRGRNSELEAVVDGLAASRLDGLSSRYSVTGNESTVLSFNEVETKGPGTLLLFEGTGNSTVTESERTSDEQTDKPGTVPSSTTTDIDEFLKP